MPCGALRKEGGRGCSKEEEVITAKKDDDGKKKARISYHVLRTKGGNKSCDLERGGNIRKIGCE